MMAALRRLVRGWRQARGERLQARYAQARRDRRPAVEHWLATRPLPGTPSTKIDPALRLDANPVRVEGAE